MNKKGLDSTVARHIIESLGSNGTPPEWGVSLYSVGLEPYLDLVREDYLQTFVRDDGGATFKLVVGTYGGGKTHFLYAIREEAWAEDFVVSYVVLSPEETPFSDLSLVYRSVAKNMMPPLTPRELMDGGERGLSAFLHRWYTRLTDLACEQTSDEKEQDSVFEDLLGSATRDLENQNFLRAIQAAMRALRANDDETYQLALQWLLGEGYDHSRHSEMGILRKQDRSQAFSLLRSLVQLSRNAGFAGLVILFDEAEIVPSMSSRAKDLLLSNLREVVDACAQHSFRNVMIFYAVPNESFLEGRAAVYEALKQRLATVFDIFNPTGVRIDLEQLEGEPEEILADLGDRLRFIYQTAFRCILHEKKSKEGLRQMARKAYELRFGDIGYKRLFVQGAVRYLHLLRRKPDLEIDEDQADLLLQGEAVKLCTLGQRSSTPVMVVESSRPFETVALRLGFASTTRWCCGVEPPNCGLNSSAPRPRVKIASWMRPRRSLTESWEIRSARNPP